jgi:hypothetical protein
MRLSTRLVRNVSFAAMMAVVLLFRQQPIQAAECGPYYCYSACQMQGGYIGWRGCQGGSCDPETMGCGGNGDGCNEFCMYCDLQWICGPIGG